MLATTSLLVRLNSLIFLAHKIFCHVCSWFFFGCFSLIPMLSSLMIMVGLDGKMMYLEWFLYWVFRNSWPLESLDFISQLEFILFALQLFDNIPQWKEFGIYLSLNSAYFDEGHHLSTLIFSSFLPICFYSI